MLHESSIRVLTWSRALSRSCSSSVLRCPHGVTRCPHASYALSSWRHTLSSCVTRCPHASYAVLMRHTLSSCVIRAVILASHALSSWRHTLSSCVLRCPPGVTRCPHVSYACHPERSEANAERSRRTPIPAAHLLSRIIISLEMLILPSPNQAVLPHLFHSLDLRDFIQN
jgi:hypothetical protein